MRSIALLVTLLLLPAARAGAQAAAPPPAQPLGPQLILKLVAPPQEIALEHEAAVSGRSIFIAGVVLQGVALTLFTPLSIFGVGGNSSGVIGFGSVALIMGTTSLVLIPIGAAKWARHAKQERLLREGVFVF